MKKRGRGIACMWYGIGKTGVPNPSRVKLNINENGMVTIYTGAADIGQGSNTILRQIVAETLSIPLEKINLVSADTASTPDSGVSSASRQTFVTGKAVKMAAEELKEKLLEATANLHAIDRSSIFYSKGNLYIEPRQEVVAIKDVVSWCKENNFHLFSECSYSPPTVELDKESGQGSPYATYAFGTQVAEVEVDTVTGFVEILKLCAVHDVGKAINPVMAEGQIEGGCVMGLGYSLIEDYDHRKVKRAFADYLIPTSMDVPEIETILVEDNEPEGPFGAKGLGEPPVVATAAAIANAIADALGIRIFSLPITPEKILEAIEDSKTK